MRRPSEYYRKDLPVHEKEVNWEIAPPHPRLSYQVLHPRGITCKRVPNPSPSSTVGPKTISLNSLPWRLEAQLPVYLGMPSRLTRRSHYKQTWQGWWWHTVELPSRARTDAEHATPTWASTNPIAFSASVSTGPNDNPLEASNRKVFPCQNTWLLKKYMSCYDCISCNWLFSTGKKNVNPEPSELQVARWLITFLKSRHANTQDDKKGWTNPGSRALSILINVNAFVRFIISL